MTLDPTGAPAPEPTPAPAAEPVAEPVAPAPEPPAPEVDPDDAVAEFDEAEFVATLDAMFDKKLDERIPKPEPEPEADPYEGMSDTERALAEKADALERRLAEVEAGNKAREDAAMTRAAEAAQAAFETRRIAEIKATAKTYSMTKEEVLAVADYVDKNLTPEIADKVPFERLVFLVSPEIAARRKTANGAQPSAPSNGPAPAQLVTVGSGGDPAPTNRHPGPGKGFADINREALREYAGKLFTEE